MEGVSLSRLFELNEGKSISYDDLIVLPGYIGFGVDEVDLSTQLTRNIRLNTPIVSSPMDTVTEGDMAIQMALLGGIGIIHCNMSVDEQVTMVKRVKRFENGFVTDPVCLGRDNVVGDVYDIKKHYGFSGIPITETGEIGGKLLGIVSSRDIDFVDDMATRLGAVMETDMIVGREDITLEDANDLLARSKKSKLPIVNEKYELIALTTRCDLKKNKDYPLASKDSAGHLLVGAAVGTREADRERVLRLVEAGVDVIVIDSSQGNSKYQIEMIKHIKAEYNVDVIAGNVVTRAQAWNLIGAGCDALRVGMGVGSICTTQEVMAVGRGQASSIWGMTGGDMCVTVPVIADGGIRNIGHISKALALGASTVMLGSLLAGTAEAPGDYFYRDGVRLKKYRGMGSIEAMSKGSEQRYFDAVDSNVRVAQGVVGTVKDRGSLRAYVPYLLKGLQHSFQDIGVSSIAAIHKAARAGILRVEMRTPAAQFEGNVHSLHSYEKQFD